MDQHPIGLAKANDTVTEPQTIGSVLERLKLPYARDIAVAREEAAQRRHAELEHKARFRRQLGPRYATCTFDNWQAATAYQQKVKSAAIEWAAGKGLGGLVLYGPVGTGKDHLIVAAIDNRIQRPGCHATAAFMNGREFVGEVRDRISDDSPEAELIARWRRPDVLLISDPLPPIGDLTQHQADMLYRVVEARYSDGKVTCCTLNVADDSEADRRLGAATWDRLCDGAWKVHCRWNSHRKPAMELRP